MDLPRVNPLTLTPIGKGLMKNRKIMSQTLSLTLANLNGAQERALRRLKRQAGEFLYGHG
jgi:hypothetical protein